MYPHSVNPDQIVGNWLSPDKDIIVRCYKAKNGKFYGKLAWFKICPESTYAENSCDIKENQWLNKFVLTSFEFEDNEWNDGTIHNLRDCNKLKATGFIFFRWLSESIVLTKYTGGLPKQC